MTRLHTFGFASHGPTDGPGTPTSGVRPEDGVWLSCVKASWHQEEAMQTLRYAGWVGFTLTTLILSSDYSLSALVSLWSISIRT